MDTNGLALLLQEPGLTVPMFAVVERGSIFDGYDLEQEREFASWLLQVPLVNVSDQMVDRRSVDKSKSLFEKTITQRFESFKAQELRFSSAGSRKIEGKMIKKSVNSRLSTDGSYLLCQSEFANAQSNVSMSGGGRWMFEVALESIVGNLKVGWVSSSCRLSDGDQVGDTADSYGYDGAKCWNSRYSSAYGNGWIAGDVIGIGLDLENAAVCFWRNGVALGPAFNGSDRCALKLSDALVCCNSDNEHPSKSDFGYA